MQVREVKETFVEDQRVIKVASNRNRKAFEWYWFRHPPSNCFTTIFKCEQDRSASPQSIALPREGSPYGWLSNDALIEHCTRTGLSSRTKEKKHACPRFHVARGVSPLFQLLCFLDAPDRKFSRRKPLLNVLVRPGRVLVAVGFRFFCWEFFSAGFRFQLLLLLLWENRALLVSFGYEVRRGWGC